MEVFHVPIKYILKDNVSFVTWKCDMVVTSGMSWLLMIQLELFLTIHGHLGYPDP